MVTTARPIDISFLGRGIKMPFNVSSEFFGGKTEVAEGYEYYSQLVIMLFDTAKYSRPMRRNLGMNKNYIIFKPILSSLRSQMEFYLKESLESFGESRISIYSVDIDWTKSKGSTVCFVVLVTEKSTGQQFPVSYLWDYSL